MPSGVPITEEQADAILRLAAKTDSLGAWQHSYAEIARLTGLAEVTVRRTIREAAVRYGLKHRWTSEPY